MTGENRRKSFDCVKSMREIRDRISAEIAGLSYEELRQWLDERAQKDPLFERIRQFPGSDATETMPMTDDEFEAISRRSASELTSLEERTRITRRRAE